MADTGQRYDSAGAARKGRRRRADRRSRIRWGRLVLLLVLLVIVAVTAGSAGTIVALSHNLPSLETMQARRLGTTTQLFDRSGDWIANIYGSANRQIVSSRQIPKVMKEATVAKEDRRFYDHHGVDFEGLARALVEDIKSGSYVQGGSTITEQYVKNAYLGSEQTIQRKLREAILAWQLEDKWSKDKILTEYLNIVYYGAHAYGVQAASETYFHKPIAKVSLPEAALLAALPRFPSEYTPTVAPKLAKQQRNIVLDLMAAQGYITPARAAAAKATPMHVYSEPPSTTKGQAAYFVDYVTRELEKKYGAREVLEGGLRVYTSLDMKMQNAGIAAMKERLPSQYAGALVSVEPSTGYIRAMVASTDWKTTKFNLTWQSQRQPGSAMKPFALIAAVEEGANPATTFYNSHPLHVPMPGSPTGYWDVNTAEHSSGGRMNLVSATLASDNTIFAQLALDLGPDKIVKVAKKMGITTPLYALPSIVLGSEEVNPLEMADAYATMASEGIHHSPESVERVVFPDGHVDKTKTKGTRVVSQGVMYTVDKILELNTSPSGGTPHMMTAYYQGRSAGKTGTTEDSADAWFCGFNPKLATAFWMGYPQARIPMPGVFGATYGVPVWGTYYNLVYGSLYIADFPIPGVMPAWKPWKGKYSMMSMSPSPSPSKSKSGKPSPLPTYTVKPSHTPTPTPSPTKTKTPTPTPTPTPTGTT
jgi:penicillin-binding protein 1A